MFSAVRRGLFLGRALRASTVRAAPSRVSQLPSLWQSSSLKAFPATTRHLHSSPVLGDAAAATATAQPNAPDAQGEERITKFEALAENGLVNANIVDAITKDMGISEMTDVQSLTIHETLRGQDVFAQAKTGTGKTLAFLVPVLQNILRCDPSLATGKTYHPTGSVSAADIRAIIISPTRELAEQIAREATKVARNTGLIVQTAVGGTRKREGLERIRRQGCHVLVGTPGRLHDILSDKDSGVTAPKMTALVLDEADRLLDIGFASAIDEIQTLLPERESRQTLMFSATLPREVINMVRTTMKPNFKFLKTVKEHETPTHHKVPQRAVFMNGLENQYIALYELAQQAIARHKEDPENNKPFKAIVYYNSTAEVALAKMAFQRMRFDASDKWAADPFDGITMNEMHSRLAQLLRTRQSETFRRATSGILFSSDVTARGMDFPNVSHVIQIGLPRDQETYVHRLGRTARANKEGEGWLFCTPAESYLLKQTLRGIPIKEDSTTLSTASVDLSNVEALPPTAAETFTKFSNVFRRIPYQEKEAAYMGLIGRACQSRDKAEGIRALNNLAMRGWGLSMLPKVNGRLVQTLGLRNVREVNTTESPVDDRDRGFGGRDRSFGGRDRGSSGRDRGSSGRDREFGGRDREFGGGRRRGFSQRDGASDGRRGGFGGRGRGGDDFSDRGFYYSRE